MPLMCGEFTSPCTASPTHATEQVKGAAEGRAVGRREVACGAVSGKSLARVPSKLCCAFEQSGCDELILIPSSSELDQVTLLAEAVK